jgi:hypothetical protein
VRVPWKLIGVAGLASVAATGVVVARNRRSQHDYDPGELRDRLHQRLSEIEARPIADSGPRDGGER